jgi:hypothetical protein
LSRPLARIRFLAALAPAELPALIFCGEPVRAFFAAVQVEAAARDHDLKISQPAMHPSRGRLAGGPHGLAVCHRVKCGVIAGVIQLRDHAPHPAFRPEQM